MQQPEFPEGFQPLRPVLNLLSALRLPWWLTGGWAIDLAVGYVSRPHNGIDLYMVAGDAMALPAQLSGVAFELGDPPRPWGSGTPTLKPGDRLVIVAPELPLPTQFAFCEPDGADWVFTDEPAIRLPMAEAVTSRCGVPHLALAVILFLRAFSFRAQDQADFETALPLLTARERGWLEDAIERRASELPLPTQTRSHPWIEALRRGRP
ncbi:MAG TPA: hypothetical protein VNF07_13070 [Acidimicrobiales bacterium]|nr:hypothetical protein [Acidimicrobiales bacterium]